MFEKTLLLDICGIITGGSSGIGLEIAKFLVQHGAKITITGRNEDKLKNAVKEIGDNAIWASGDVRKAEDVKANFKKHMDTYGKVEFLINNAAGNFLCPLEKMSENAFKAVMDIVTHGTFLWCQAVHPIMKKQEFGRIINTGTTYAWGHAAYVAHSGAAKAAVMNLTKSMAIEWGPEGILTNMIAPGAVDGTEGVKRLLAFPKAKSKFETFCPIKRMAKGSEVAAVVAFLLSPMGAYINGAVIPIDGGMHLLNPGLLPPVVPRELLVDEGYLKKIKAFLSYYF